jgi:hypothetical protein
MKWDYVSELLPPVVLLFIPKVIYEHGEQCWNDIVVGTPDSFTRPLSSNYQSRLVANQEEFIKVYDEFSLRNMFVHTSKLRFTCRKILRHGVDSIISPPNEGVLRIFMALKGPCPLPGLNPRISSPKASTLTITPPRRLLDSSNHQLLLEILFQLFIIFPPCLLLSYLINI